jgi:hypothetical protein
MRRDFRILQANLRKMPETQQSLLNDEDVRDFGLLLIQEPYCFRIDRQDLVSPVYHPYWTAYTPTAHDHGSRWPFRSMIWAHRDLAVKQIPVASSDVTAVVAELEGRQILAISIYVPARESEADDELISRLDCVRQTIYRVRRQHSPQSVEVIVAGDFNRHDQLWGGDEVGTTARQGEGEPIIDLLQEFELDSLLPRGTITYESPNGDSTIDLTLASTSLAEDRIQCGIYPSEHGSDHRAIQTASTSSNLNRG